MQTWFIWFYDVRADLTHELEELAFALGGRLEVPQLRKKYRWIERIGGRRMGRHAQELLPRMRWTLSRFWDRICLRVGKIGIPD